MIQFKDWWRAERPAFAGSGALYDAAEADSPAESRRAIARVMVIQAAAALVGDPRPALVDAEGAAGYLVGLIPPGDPEMGPLLSCLGATQRRDVHALAHATRKAAEACLGRGSGHSARSLAQLSFRAARENGDWAAAQRAAALLERIAVLDENFEAALRWRSRAIRYEVRVQNIVRRPIIGDAIQPGGTPDA